MRREDAARKVRALRATAAPGSGATDPERATAGRLADRMVAEHGLDRPAPARRDYSGSFTVDIGANAFYHAFSSDGFYTTEELKEVMRRKSALDEKRRRFREILNGNFRNNP